VLTSNQNLRSSQHTSSHAAAVNVINLTVAKQKKQTKS